MFSKLSQQIVNERVSEVRRRSAHLCTRCACQLIEIVLFSPPSSSPSQAASYPMQETKASINELTDDEGGACDGETLPVFPVPARWHHQNPAASDHQLSSTTLSSTCDLLRSLSPRRLRLGMARKCMYTLPCNPQEAQILRIKHGLDVTLKAPLCWY